MKFGKIVGLIALGITILYWLYFPRADRPSFIRHQAIQKQNDSLQNKNQELTNHIKVLRKEATHFQQRAQRQRQLLYRLKSQQNERMQAITGFDNDELYRFFARFKTAPSEN